MAENNADNSVTTEPPLEFTHVPQEKFVETREIEAVCRRYASDTWSGLKIMSQTPTGYPEDMTRIEDGKETSNKKTSPSNIGLFLSSIVAARDMHLILPEEADHSIDTVLTSLEKADKYEGLFYNWYDTQTGSIAEKTDRPFISTIDNAWLTVGLMTIQAAFSPEYSKRANKIIKEMNVPLLYSGEQNLFYGGYYPDSQEPTEWHYDILNTEARIASYVWIKKDKDGIPPINYSCLGRVPSQNGQHFLSWGGSMFEALMPTLFVPEQEWSPTWENNHREYIKKQIQYGKQHNNGFWGYSPCYNETYNEEGLAELAIKEGGYEGFDGSSHIVTPHALFLSLPFMSTEAIEGIQQLERTYPALYKKGIGFSDSVDVQTGNITRSYLSIDQEMSFISLFNYLSGNKMHDYISPQLEVVKPLITFLGYKQPLAA